MTRITPEFDQRIADWLEDDPGPAPRQVETTILAALPSIRQRRNGWFRAGGRTLDMPNFMRFAAAAAIVAVAGAALTILNQAPGTGGPGPSPTPSLAPPASVAPTQTDVSLGTITLTDTGCTWTDKPGLISAAKAPVIGQLQVINETDTFGNFGIYRIADGRTWEEAVTWVEAMNAEAHGGPAASAPTGDFVTDVGNVDAPERKGYPTTLTLGSGVHGVLCSSNEPPPGQIFAVYLVGPLEVTVE
jgi:hypothetical protein